MKYRVAFDPRQVMLFPAYLTDSVQESQDGISQGVTCRHLWWVISPVMGCKHPILFTKPLNKYDEISYVAHYMLPASNLSFCQPWESNLHVDLSWYQWYIYMSAHMYMYIYIVISHFGCWTLSHSPDVRKPSVRTEPSRQMTPKSRTRASCRSIWGRWKWHEAFQDLVCKSEKIYIFHIFPSFSQFFATSFNASKAVGTCFPFCSPYVDFWVTCNRWIQMLPKQKDDMCQSQKIS